ncbi:MAG: carboxypeptidase-like regulatory domain-containing protein [bacterium]
MNFRRSAGRLIGIAAALVIAAGGIVASANAGPPLINLRTLTSTENTSAALVLNSVPLNITESADTLEITWTPAVTGIFNYAPGSPGSNLNAYNSLSNPLLSQPGRIRVLASRLPVGPLTCFIRSSSSGTDISTFFRVLRAAASAAVPQSPITPAGGSGISTTSPTITWQGVTGVPYYLVFVADQPFTIIKDDQGTRVEGANVVWQAITPNTSIQYGVPDPSGTIANEMVPPLVGSNSSGTRPRYNWTVLNCYGNSVEYTSSVVGQVSGFEVQTTPPFTLPVLQSPQRGAALFDPEIRFQWSIVSQASSYFVYLSRFQLYSNGTEILFPVWRAQTTDNAVILPAASLLQGGQYNWKVIASDGLGSGTISDSSSFTYVIESGELRITTKDATDNPIDLAQVDFEAVQGPNIQSIATDDNGSYHFLAPVGSYILHAHKQGYLDATSATVSVVKDVVRSIAITMQPRPSTVVGKVTSNSGSPIGNATVRATSALGVQLTATTNTSGEFTVGLNVGTWTFKASAPSYQPSSTRTVTVTSGQTLDLNNNGGPLLLIPYTFTVNGTVLNTNSQPIPLGQVVIQKGIEQASTFTGESGRYSFTVGNGTWTLSAIKAGYYLPSGPISVVVNGANVTKNITLNPQAAIISGFIAEGGTVMNRGGVTVQAVPSAGEIVTTTTADNGSFNLGLPPGTWVLKGVLSGYTAQPVTLTLGPGETSNGVTLNLAPNPSSISGTVRTPSGSPVSQATVTGGGAATTSNNSGAFTLSVPAGTHTLTISRTGYSTESSGPWTVNWGEAQTGVVATLAPNVATVSGVVAYGGTGIIGATVTATPSTGGTSVQVTTGSGGSYTLGLIPGTCTITARKSGFSVLNPTSLTLTMQPGSVTTGRNFALQPNTGTVSGLISSSAGPLYGVTVTIRPSGTTTGGITTSSSVTGAFSISVESGKAYTVIATKTSFSSASATTGVLTAGGQQQVSLTMSLLGASISGKVSSSDGSPLENATVVASSGASAVSTTTGPSGTYSLSVLPGTWTMDISAATHLTATSSVTVSGGQNLSNVNYSLTANYATVSGSVKNASNAVLSGATVELKRSDGTVRQTTSDAGGFFQFLKVTGGRYTLYGRKTGFTPDTLTVGLVVDGQVISGSALRLVAQTSSITGSVTSSGSPVSNATVRATLSTGATYSTLSGSNGTYTIPTISAGTYRVEALKSGYTATPLTGQTVAPNATLTVNLTATANTGSLTGTIKDQAGAGLTGVQVRAVSGTGYSVESISSPGGVYTINGLNLPDAYDLTFTLSGYQINTVAAAHAGNTYNVTMPRNALTISGTTANQTPTALGNVPVRVTSLSDGSVLTTTSSAAGVWTITGVATNSNCRITTALGAGTTEEADVTVTTGTSNVTGVALTLIQRTASIRGTTGESGVTLTAARSNGGTRVAYSDVAGAYRFENINSGTWVVAPAKPGTQYSPASRTISSLAVGEARTAIDFTPLVTTVNIGGKVHDDAGNPLIGATVVLIASSSTQQATTDSLGTFTFSALPGFTDYSLTVNTGVATRISETRSVSATDTNITSADLTVTIKEGVISGTILDEGGAAINSASITLDNSSPVYKNSLYSLRNLGKGTHTLVFSKQGYRAVRDTVFFEDGQVRDTLNITLVSAVDQITYLIYLKPEDTNIPQRGIVVSISGNDIRDTSLVSDGLGFLTFTGLDPDSVYTISVSPPGFQARVITGVAPGSSLNSIRLTPLTNGVFGVFTDKNGEPLSGAEVELRARSGEIHSTVTDAYGRYGLLAPSGSLVLLGTNSDGSATSYQHGFAVPAGSFVMRDLTLRTTGELTGTASTSSGTALSSRVLYETENLTTGTFSFIYGTSDGTYRLRGLRPGILTVHASADGYVIPDSQEVELPAGEILNLDWTFTAESTSITGRVTNVEGGGLPNAVVTAVGSQTLSTVTGGSGDFGFTNIASGSWAVSADKYGYQTASVSIDLTSGEVAAANLTLDAVADLATGTIFGFDGNDPAPDIIIRWKNDAGNTLETDTTDSAGHFSFTLTSDGGFTVQPSSATSPSNRTFLHTSGEGHPDLDFVLVPGQGSGTIQGSLVHRTTPVQGATIVMSALDGTHAYTTSTDSMGGFAQSVSAPYTYRISATHDSLGTVESAGFLLSDGETATVNLVYASGQIGVTIVDESGNPVAGNVVSVASTDGLFSVVLVTDVDGVAITDPYLSDGDYLIEVTPVTGLLPVAPLSRSIVNGDSIGVVIPLGLPYTPPSVGNVGDSITVQIQVPDSYTIVSALLYYTAVGEGFSRTVPMVEVTSTSSGSSSVSAPTLFRHVDRSVRKSITIPSHSVRGGTSIAANVTYQGMIPPQSGSGTITFYPELTTDSGLVIGGPGGASTLTVSSIGRLSRVVLSPSVEEVQPGVPLLLTVSAFDELDSLLTESVIDSGSVTWSSSMFEVDTSGLRADSAIYLSTGEGLDTVRVLVTQETGSSTLTASSMLPLNNVMRTLGTLQVSAPSIEIAAGDSIVFTVVATDTGGTLMQVAPEWTVDSLYQSNFAPTPFTQNAVFQSDSGKFGTVRISATDPLTSILGIFNDQNGAASEGLTLYVPVTSAPGDSFVAEGIDGTRLTGWFSAEAIAGNQGSLRLRTPKLVQLQRFQQGIEALQEVGHRILLQGSLNEERVAYELTLLLPAGAPQRNPSLARWDIDNLKWIELDGSTVSSDGESITAPIVPTPSQGVEGLYAVIAGAKPLAIDNLIFTPNPFSPEGDYPLSVEFELQSLFPNVWLTIEIYNMVGQHVRTLIDRVSVEKGVYSRLGGVGSIIWNGLTEDGRQARNGRYVVRVIAEDPEGRKEELKPVVLIK